MPILNDHLNKQKSADPNDLLFNATLIERQDINDQLIIVKVKPDNLPIKDFKPGQFASLGLPNLENPTDPQQTLQLIRRSFSIASSPDEKEYLEFYVSLVENGRLTPKLWPIKKGDRLFLSPTITGTFTLDEVPANKNLVLVSTGTGLAPYISMLRYFLLNNRWKWNHCAIIHGVRHLSDLGYRQELETLTKNNSQLTYIPTISRDQNVDWSGMRGHVQAAFDSEIFTNLTKMPLTPSDTHILLCGNPKMIDQMVVLLKNMGFEKHRRKSPGNLHFEKYWG